MRSPEAGTTTVLAGGGPANELALAEPLLRRVDRSRVIPSGTINLRQTPAEARAAVQSWRRWASSTPAKSR
jgi:hypothetical protein